MICQDDLIISRLRFRVGMGVKGVDRGNEMGLGIDWRVYEYQRAGSHGLYVCWSLEGSITCIYNACKLIFSLIYLQTSLSMSLLVISL